MEFLSLRYNGGPLVPYAAAWEYQKKRVEKRAADFCSDAILFLEHYPVVTRGRGLQKGSDGTEKVRSVPIQTPLPQEFDYFDVERGGDLTFHGPGQLVIYPILKLNPGAGGIVSLIRRMESALIEALSDFGLNAKSVRGSTGVWVGEKKIASLGMSLRKNVTYHGMAINIVNDLKPFSFFSPCGFQAEVMTNLKTLNLKSVGPDLNSWRSFWENRWMEFFSPSSKNHSIRSVEITGLRSEPVGVTFELL